MEFETLSLDQLFTLAAQSVSELSLSRAVMHEKGMRASREDVVLVHESALGLRGITKAIIEKAHELDKKDTNLDKLERMKVNYVLSETQPILDAATRLIDHLGKRYSWLAASRPGA